MQKQVDYLIIGAGPAAICAVAKLHYTLKGRGNILWVDPEFKVGDFGTLLSVGSSVPGNTTVAGYQRVNNAIYQCIPACAPTAEEMQTYQLNTLSGEETCFLKLAALPLQHISNKLRQLIHHAQGSVLAIDEVKLGLKATIQLNDGKLQSVLAKRIILAIGAQPKTISLPAHIELIDPNIAFIESELDQYLTNHPNISTMAVIGSSHSAALATMHLLKAGIAVKQFMNKDYKFAERVKNADGTVYTRYDNTGLKGEVAKFTKQLLAKQQNQEKVKWQYYINHDKSALNEMQLSGCTHAVACVGYATRQSLKINGLSVANFHYNKTTTQIITQQGDPVKGVFGFGIAFPIEVTAISGETEYAVGVEKFWNTLNDEVLSYWHHCSVEFFASYGTL